MKTTTIIIAAVLSLQFSALSADNPEGKVVTESSGISVNTIILAPVTPLEADFSDVIPEPVEKILTLAPLSPSEADFNDNAPEKIVNTPDLAPETPSSADFQEMIPIQENTSILVPVTPAEADFE